MKIDKSFSSITFLWICVFSWKQIFRRSAILINELPSLPASFEADVLYLRFQHHWTRELNRSSPRIWKALIHTFRSTISVLIILSTLFLIFQFSFVSSLLWQINTIEDEGFESTLSLMGISCLVSLCAVLYSFSIHTMEYGFHIVGMKCRILLTTALYHHLQNLSASQVDNLSVGNILTIITSNLFKFDEVLHFFVHLILLPIQGGYIIALSYLQIGWPAFLILIMFPIQIVTEFAIGRAINRTYKKLLTYSDIRNKHIREFIEGIHMIKAFAWEYAVAKTISRIRRREFYQILINYFFKSLSITFATSIHILYTFAICVSVFAVVGEKFSAGKIFSFSVLMGILGVCSWHVSYGIVGLAELQVCVKRVQHILQWKQQNIPKMSRISQSKEYDIIADGLSAGRLDLATNEIAIAIQDISLNLKRGEFLLVIGKVGSGKSSLLLSLLGEIDIARGRVELNGSCAFVPQEAWIFPTSVRNNIIYGRGWDEEWYEKVIVACCLDVDMAQLEELTIVGERGITLSGGQRARISLARAVYANFDIYLLDDPLSSVDTKVGKKILSIFTTGLLHTKTVIMVTHQLQFSIHADKVLKLEDGIEVLNNTPIERNEMQFLDNSQSDQGDRLNSINTASKSDRGNYIDSIKMNTSVSKLVSPMDYGYENQAFDTDDGTISTEKASILENTQKEKMEFKDIFVREGVNQLQANSLKVFAVYIWNGGNVIGILSIILIGMFTFFNNIIVKNYLLIWWISGDTYLNPTISPMNASSTNPRIFNPLKQLSTQYWISIFLTFSFLVSVIRLVVTVTIAWVMATSSYRLHNKMLWKVLRAPIQFFNFTSSGSVINRFSKDIATMDHLLPNLIVNLFTFIFIILFTLIAATIGHWLSILPSLVLLALLLIFRYQFVKVIKQVKRFESATKSDVISQFSLSLHGLTTIHSLKLESYQNKLLYTLQNIHSSCWRTYYGYIRFFAFQIDFIIALYMLLVSIIFVLFRQQLTPVVAAFVIFQVSFLLNLSQFSLRISAEVEMNLVSIERVLEYIELPEEAVLRSNIPCVATKGEIRFNQVKLRYAKCLPLALKGSSFRVRAGEKVGIVGRTGAGKSSIMTALLRIVEIDSGAISIDGVNTLDMGLHDLREQISVIPQNPVLFCGPLRYALDPMSNFIDKDLWRALEEVQLKEKVSRLPGQLEFIVSEGGSNFSVGERQLFCLARSILKQSKIVMLDEATSNVDSETDGNIQKILHSKFNHCSVLTIAHRLCTVMNYDRIIVMDNGRVTDFDTPHNLMKQSTGIFKQLASV